MTNINITINDKNRTIELTKTVAKAASKFGSEAYVMVQQARHDNPSYRVIVVAHKAVKPVYKGLTFAYMKKYIAAHDEEDGSIMAEFLNLRGESEEAKAIGAMSAEYSDIKEWFFQQYPEIQKFHEDREKLLKAVMEEKARKMEARKAA